MRDLACDLAHDAAEIAALIGFGRGPCRAADAVRHAFEAVHEREQRVLRAASGGLHGGDMAVDLLPAHGHQCCVLALQGEVPLQLRRLVPAELCQPFLRTGDGAVRLHRLHMPRHRGQHIDRLGLADMATGSIAHRLHAFTETHLPALPPTEAEPPASPRRTQAAACS